jgi:hypothetical protein
MFASAYSEETAASLLASQSDACHDTQNHILIFFPKGMSLRNI